MLRWLLKYVTDKLLTEIEFQAGKWTVYPDYGNAFFRRASFEVD